MILVPAEAARSTNTVVCERRSAPPTHRKRSPGGGCGVRWTNLPWRARCSLLWPKRTVPTHLKKPGKNSPARKNPLIPRPRTSRSSCRGSFIAGRRIPTAPRWRTPRFTSAVRPRFFSNARGARLDPVIRRYLGSCLKAPFSFHEILRCDPGHGFQARDLFTGEERAVLERMRNPGDATRRYRIRPAGHGGGHHHTRGRLTLLYSADLQDRAHRFSQGTAARRAPLHRRNPV